MSDEFDNIANTKQPNDKPNNIKIGEICVNLKMLKITIIRTKRIELGLYENKEKRRVGRNLESP